MPLPAGNPAEVTFNVLDLGFTGSQLCWQARLSSPNQYCQPTINSISVGLPGGALRLVLALQPQHGGQLLRLRHLRDAGAELDRALARRSPPAPSTRNYDGKPDLSTRGHLYLKSIYDPEKPDRHQPGAALGLGRQAGDRPLRGLSSNRRLLTVDSTGKIATLSTVNTAEDLLLPATQLCRVNGGKYVYDLNSDGVCTSTDRDFVKDWLYGWEDNQ